MSNIFTNGDYIIVHCEETEEDYETFVLSTTSREADTTEIYTWKSQLNTSLHHNRKDLTDLKNLINEVLEKTNNQLATIEMRP